MAAKKPAKAKAKKTAVRSKASKKAAPTGFTTRFNRIDTLRVPTSEDQA